MPDIPIIEAAELFGHDERMKRVMKLVAELTQTIIRIVEGPVEDVPIRIQHVWIVGVQDSIFYLTASLDAASQESEAIRQDLVSRIQRLPEARINRLRVTAGLKAHQLARREACCGLFTANRIADNIEITIVCHSPAFTLEEASSLLKETAQRSNARHN